MLDLKNRRFYIIEGVSIGDGAIIAANAMVVKDVPDMQSWVVYRLRLLDIGFRKIRLDFYRN